MWLTMLPAPPAHPVLPGLLRFPAVPLDLQALEVPPALDQAESMLPAP
jgi:hypothetical protein